MIYFAPAVTPEQLYTQDKRKRVYDAKERRNDRILAAYYARQEYIEKELDRERKEAELRPLIIIMKGLCSALDSIFETPY